MTTSINAVPAEMPIVVNEGSIGYGLNEIFMPNQVLAAPTDGVNSVTVTNAGSAFTGVPSVSFTPVSGGSGATATARMKALTISSIGTPQSGAGSYVPGDTVTLAETTAATQPVVTVTHTQVVSATVAAGGTGGTPGTQTVTGTTGTGTKFQASVTVSGGGAITAVLSISVAGDYTVNPTDITQEPVTGASLTGAKLSVKMGFLNGTISTPGVISALASNPVPQGSTSGTGTGLTLNLTYGVNSIVMGAAGSGYLLPPTVGFSGGSGSGAAATAVLSGTTDTINFVFTDADGIAQPLPTTNYTVKTCADEPSFCEITSKTVDGFTLIVNPLDTEGLAAGHVDVSVSYTN